MKKNGWKETFGRYGFTVTVYERRKQGPLYLRFWDPQGQRTIRRSLGHRDRARAMDEAMSLSNDLRMMESTHHGEVPTVGLVLRRYLAEETPHKKQPPAEDRRRAHLWEHFLGSDLTADRITFRLLDDFVRQRRKGTIDLPNHRLRSNPREDTIRADLVFLRRVLNWATEGDGRLLERNPTLGFKLPKTTSPRQPVATYDRYLKIRAQDIDPQGLFPYVMDLVYGLGWRIRSILQLRATDVDLTNQRIFKRGEHDKTGVEMWVPLPAWLVESLQGLLRMTQAIGDVPLFPAPRARQDGQPRSWSYSQAKTLYLLAEKTASLPGTPGSIFHKYRRQWATDRKDFPDVDVAAAGGWKSLQALRRCYQHTDEATLRRVMEDPNRGVGGAK